MGCFLIIHCCIYIEYTGEWKQKCSTDGAISCNCLLVVVVDIHHNIVALLHMKVQSYKPKPR